MRVIEVNNLLIHIHKSLIKQEFAYGSNYVVNLLNGEQYVGVFKS